MNRQKVDTPWKVVNLWDKGVLARGELSFLLLQTLAPDGTEDFARAVTPTILDMLLEAIGEAPTTDEGWGRMRTSAGASRVGPGTEETAASLRRDEKEAIRRYRDGVELLRTFRSCLVPGHVVADPEWRTSTVVALARQMYEARDFSAMPILADALQDTGCDSDEVLAHCRDPKSAHVRGCWVVDLVLGEE